MSSRMPGSFPGSFPESADEQAPTSDTYLFSNNQQESTLATDIVDYSNLRRFTNKQEKLQNSRAQRNLLSILNTLVYILVWYQFVRYYFLAAMTPVILHLAIQKILLVDTIINTAHGSPILSSAAAVGVIPIINDMVSHQGTDATKITKLICSCIYWKFILLVGYDFIFLFLWVFPLIEQNRLNELEFGTWWFVNFIGESPPQIAPDATIKEKLYGTGIIGMISINFLLLFIQLILFQCTFIQLTVAPQGRILLVEEIEQEIIRLAGDPTSTTSRTNYTSVNNSNTSIHRISEGFLLSILSPIITPHLPNLHPNVSPIQGSSSRDCIQTQTTPPVVLQVRLYQLFSWRSFTS